MVGIEWSGKTSEEVRFELGLGRERELAMNFWPFQVLGGWGWRAEDLA